MRNVDTYLTTPTWLWAPPPNLPSHHLPDLFPPPKYAPGCAITSHSTPALPKGCPKKHETYSVPDTWALLVTMCLAVSHSTVCNLDTLWSDERFVTAQHCQGLAMLGIDSCERSSHSHVMMRDTAKQTDQTVSEQQSLKAEVSGLYKWIGLMNIYK